MSELYCKIRETDLVFPLIKGQSVLESAYYYGVELHHHCQSGFCGACKARLCVGRVDMRHAGGISRRDIGEGYILTCCTWPLTDIEIEMD